MTNIIRLGDVTSINPESICKNYPYKDINYIDISSVGIGTIHGSKNLSINDAPSRAKRIIKHGDIVLSTVRPNRRSFAFIENPKRNTIVSTGFAVLRAKDQINQRYLYYSISNKSFTDYLVKRAKGSAYPAVDNDIISNAKLLLPKIAVQKKIASVLSTYDKLIKTTPDESKS